MAALGAVVSNVDELDSVVPLLEQLVVITVASLWSLSTTQRSGLLAATSTSSAARGRPILQTRGRRRTLVAKVMVAAAEQHEDSQLLGGRWCRSSGARSGCCDRGRATGGVSLPRWAIRGGGGPAAAPRVALFQPGERSASLGAHATTSSPSPVVSSPPRWSGRLIRDTIKMGAPSASSSPCPSTSLFPTSSWSLVELA